MRSWTVAAVSIALISCTGLTGRSDHAKHATARAQIKEIATTLELYRVQKGAYPSAVDGLQALVAEKHLAKLPVDPWGRPYVYKLEGGEPEVLCFGADGKPGGEGADADISSGDRAR